MSRRPSLPDPSAVVAGRVRASIEQLFALIAEVNPTDRGLPSRVQAERYALKAKLQAVLVKQHAEVLEVVADGAPGVPPTSAASPPPSAPRRQGPQALTLHA